MEVNLKATLVGHRNPIYTLESSYDSRYLFTGGNDKGVVEWDLETFEFKRILVPVPASIYALHQIPNTKLLAVGLRSGEVFIVDIDSQKILHRLKGCDGGGVFNIKTHLGQNLLITSNEQGEVLFWSLKDFSLVNKLSLTDTTVRVIAMQQGEELAAFGDKNGEIHLYNTENWQLKTRRKIHNLSVTSMLFEGDTLFTGGRDAKMNRLETDRLETIQTIVPHMFTVYGIAKHPHAPFLVTVSRDKTTKIWDMKKLSLLRNISRDRKYDAHLLSINACLWIDYKNYIVSIADDRLVKVWEVV